MKNVGEAFAFYAKYPAEMEALYVEENADVLPKMETSELEDIEDKIDKVGDQASSEAADVLIKMTDIFLEAIQVKAGAARLRRRSTMEENWDTEIQIWPSKKDSKPRSWDFTFGASFLYLDKTLKCVIWCYAGNSKLSPERIVEKYKGSFPTATCNLDDLHRKTVTLSVLQLTPEKTADGKFLINQDELLENCKKTATLFTTKMLEDYLKNFA